MSDFVTRNITLIAGVETTIDLYLLYPPVFDPQYNNIERIYGENWAINKIEVAATSNSHYVTYTIFETENVSVLNYPLNNAFVETVFLKKIKLKSNISGTFRLLIYYGALNPVNVLYGISTSYLNSVQPPPTPTFNNINVNYNKYDRVIRLQRNVNKIISCIDLYPNGERIQITSTLPAWFTNATQNIYIGNISFPVSRTFNITPPTIGVFQYRANVYKTVRNFNTTFLYEEGQATITLIVVENLFDEIDNCCSDDNVNIVWLNRQGGRGNFIFSQRKDYNVEVGKKNTYITNDIKKYAEIKNVYNGMKVYATGLTLNQIDFLDTLRYSIQAWMFKNNNFIPILLDVDSFEKYNTKENMYEISLSFIFAEQLNIQRQ